MTQAATRNKGGKPKGRPNPPPLTDDQIKEILLSDLSDVEMGKKFGRGRNAINDIRTGKNYKKVHPEIERREPVPDRVMRTCQRCIHHTFEVTDGLTDKADRKTRVTCSLDFPEVQTMGGRAALYCNVYTEESNG